MIGRTIFAISSEESRYTLNGGLMVLKPESITMVATDGHRLAHIEKTGEQFDVTGENKTLIPKKAMSELFSLLQNSDVDQVEFAKDDSTLFFRIGERLLTSRQLTGQFPNYEAVLPRETTKSVVVHGADLNTAIQRVAQFADERSRAIRMKLDKNELKISSSSTEAGESEDSIEIAYTADAMTIGFNSEYLIDFLKASTRRRSSPGVQGRPVGRPDAPRRRQRRRLQVPLRRDADADLSRPTSQEKCPHFTSTRVEPPVFRGQTGPTSELPMTRAQLHEVPESGCGGVTSTSRRLFGRAASSLFLTKPSPPASAVSRA